MKTPNIFQECITWLCKVICSRRPSSTRSLSGITVFSKGRAGLILEPFCRGRQSPARQPWLQHCLPLAHARACWGRKRVSKPALMSCNKENTKGAGVVQCLYCQSVGGSSRADGGLCSESCPASPSVSLLPSHFIHVDYSHPWAVGLGLPGEGLGHEANCKSKC